MRYSLADTGAGPSILASGLLKQLPQHCLKEMIPLPAHVREDVKGADGKPLLVMGTVKLIFFLSERLFEHTFQVMEGGNLLILGNDFLAAHNGAVYPRLPGQQEPDYMELDHPPSGTRIRSLLTATPEELARQDNWCGAESTLYPGDSLPQVGGSSSDRKREGQVHAGQRTRHAHTGTPHRTVAAISTRSKENQETSQQDNGETEETKDHIAEEDLAELRAPASTANEVDPMKKDLLSRHMITRDHVLVSHESMSIPAKTGRTIQVRLPKELIGHDGPLL